jgi:hypothetical protein
MQRIVDVLMHDGTRGPAGYPGECREYPADAAPPAPPDGWQRLTVDELLAMQQAGAGALAAWQAAQQPADPPAQLMPLTRLAFITLIEEGLGIDYDDLPALIDQHVHDQALARAIKRALRHGAEFSAHDAPIDGVGAIMWLAQRIGLTEEEFTALWRSAES